MKKILYVATSDIHLHAFHRPYLKFLADLGYEVHIAAEDRGGYSFADVDRHHRITFRRSGLSAGHLKALKKVTDLIRVNKYELVHCHTPVPSALARVANLMAGGARTKMLYTAHGFHFYRGGPISNWLKYFPVEWVLSAVTDGIVTINREDFAHATNRLRCRKVYQIPGIGLDFEKFQPMNEQSRIALKRELGLVPEAFILLYVAEFIPRKNHEFLIGALPDLVALIPELHLVLTGEGPLKDRIFSKVKELGFETKVSFTGFTNKVPQYAAVSDIAISTSRHEGLGLGLAEQMACQVPTVASNDKGHRELISHGIEGYLYQHGNLQQFICSIRDLYQNEDLRLRFGAKAREKSKKFAIDKSLACVSEVYRNFLEI